LYLEEDGGILGEELLYKQGKKRGERSDAEEGRTISIGDDCKGL
jgi:hypothetical protein